MIRHCWTAPNFRCTVEDKDGVVQTLLLSSSSEQALRTRLEAEQLTVHRIDAYDFKQWRMRARKARQKAIRDYRAGKRPIKFDDKIWQELKTHLFDLFFGKCAYCESKPQPVSSGDVDHFRPKQKVDGEPDHPGYYWLAYSISNLLPSCERCNRTAGGKMTQFPVAGFRATKPQELKQEEPLLLHPYDTRESFEPLRHLDFNEFGTVTGRTPFGEALCRVCHLNRRGIPDERRNALKSVEQDWDVMTIRAASLIGGYTDLQDELRLGRRVYSAAQLAELDRIRMRRIALLASLGGSPPPAPAPASSPAPALGQQHGGAVNLSAP
jgi:5-methylcytosine-specific restriction endonuclease McrA